MAALIFGTSSGLGAATVERGGRRQVGAPAGPAEPDVMAHAAAKAKDGCADFFRAVRERDFLTTARRR